MNTKTCLGRYQPRTTCVPPGAALMQIFFEVFPLGWLQEVVNDPHLPFASELQLRGPQLEFADYNPSGCGIVLKIISLSSCRVISNSSGIGGSSLSDRLSKKEYRFKGMMVFTVAPSWDKSALCRIPVFVASSAVTTVVASESRYQNWLLPRFSKNRPRRPAGF